MTIAAFDTANLRTLRTDIDAALAAVCAKHGITLAVGKMTYSANEFTARLTANTAADAKTVEAVSETGLPASHAWVRQWIGSIGIFGIPKDALGKEIKVRGQRFLLAGLTRSPREPIAAKPLDRKTSKYTLLSVMEVKAALGITG